MLAFSSHQALTPKERIPKDEPLFKITVNGRPLTEQSLEEELVRAATSQLREKLGSIRHPETGEFAIIAARAGSPTCSYKSRAHPSFLPSSTNTLTLI